MNLIDSKKDLLDLPRPVRTQPIIDPNILHFGPGAFFRSFVAPLVDKLNRKSIEKWGIVAVSLNSDTTFNKLAGQAFVYNSLAISGFKKNAEKISSISKFLLAQKEGQSVINALADERISIVSLTITEKGYYYSSEKKGLDFNNKKIIEDLKDIKNPKTAIGFIVAGLKERYSKGKVPFTVLSCDNLPNNGFIIKKVILDFAKRIDPSLEKWIAEEVCFPSSMVDRITPATKNEDILNFANENGYYDPAIVVHEEFFQWVIEDKFLPKRPRFELVGIQMVKNVENHEKMKLRCLNGTHSALAYLGYLAGFKTIADCMSNNIMVDYVFDLWDKEINQTLVAPEGENLSIYCDKLLERYKNPQIEHSTWQIAKDGSQKLPQRILETVIYLIERGKSFKGLALAIAAWVYYVSGKGLDGKDIVVCDPMVYKFELIAKNSKTTRDYVDSVLNEREIFQVSLRDNLDFREQIHNAYCQIKNVGPLIAIKNLKKTKNS